MEHTVSSMVTSAPARMNCHHLPRNAQSKRVVSASTMAPMSTTQVAAKISW